MRCFDCTLQFRKRFSPRPSTPRTFIEGNRKNEFDRYSIRCIPSPEIWEPIVGACRPSINLAYLDGRGGLRTCVPSGNDEETSSINDPAFQQLY